jgi:hypothetical protein
MRSAWPVRSFRALSLLGTQRSGSKKLTQSCHAENLSKKCVGSSRSHPAARRKRPNSGSSRRLSGSQRCRRRALCAVKPPKWWASRSSCSKMGFERSIPPLSFAMSSVAPPTEHPSRDPSPGRRRRARPMAAPQLRRVPKQPHRRLRPARLHPGPKPTESRRCSTSARAVRLGPRRSLLDQRRRRKSQSRPRLRLRLGQLRNRPGQLRNRPGRSPRIPVLPTACRRLPGVPRLRRSLRWPRSRSLTPLRPLPLPPPRPSTPFRLPS